MFPARRAKCGHAARKETTVPLAWSEPGPSSCHFHLGFTAFDLGSVQLGDDAKGVFRGHFDKKMASADIHFADDMARQPGCTENRIHHIRFHKAHFLTDIDE